MGWSLLIPFCCWWVSAACWDCTDITRWRRLCVKWDCIQKVSWFSGINALQKKSKVMHLFLHLWTTNGTICSTLGVMFSKTNLRTTHSNVRANDKVGLWMRAAATWNQRQLFWERKSLRGCWTRQATPEGQLWQKVPGITCSWSTSGITVLNRDFQI